MITIHFIEKKCSGNGWTETTFGKSPIMPTYLLAFVISDLKHGMELPFDGITYRVYTREEHLNYTLSPTFNTYLFMNEMQKIFNFTYELSKLDSVAMPDHGSAMENCKGFKRNLLS